MGIMLAGGWMGRWRAALEAGRQAVAAQDVRAHSQRALIAIGLEPAALLEAVRVLSSTGNAGRGRSILIADQLPVELVSSRELVFEHLPTLAELLAAASLADARNHRQRRLAIILRRWGVTDCLWTKGEAEDLVRQAMASTGADRPAVAFRPLPGAQG